MDQENTFCITGGPYLHTAVNLALGPMQAQEPALLQTLINLGSILLFSYHERRQVASFAHFTRSLLLDKEDRTSLGA